LSYAALVSTVTPAWINLRCLTVGKEAQTTQPHKPMPNVDQTVARTVKTGKGKRGNKTIEVSIRFWTDGIGPKGTVIQKHAWDSGVISMKKNGLHWIKPRAPRPFNSILDLTSVLAKVLQDHEVVLSPNVKLSKVIKP